MQGYLDKKILLVLAIVLVLLGASHQVYALSQNGLTVGMVGSEANGRQVYVAISPNPDGCKYGGIYFFSSIVASTGERDYASPKSALAIAMTARSLNKTVRIDYLQPDGNGEQCIGGNIYVQP